MVMNNHRIKQNCMPFMGWPIPIPMFLATQRFHHFPLAYVYKRQYRSHAIYHRTQGKTMKDNTVKWLVILDHQNRRSISPLYPNLAALTEAEDGSCVVWPAHSQNNPIGIDIANSFEGVMRAMIMAGIAIDCIGKKEEQQ
jgi:hypothetical protein